MDIGIGATLELGDGTDDALVVVSPLLELTPPADEVNTWEYVEVDGDRVQKSIASITNPGEWSFSCEYTAARMARLKAVQGVDKPYRVEYVDGGELNGNAILKKAESVPGETGQVIVCNLRCSGAWSFDEPA